MPFEARLLTGLAVAVAIVYWTTPVAIRLAGRLEFFDKPVGYKGHAAPTPYLGGAAVVAGFIAAVLLLTGEWNRSLPLLGGVVVLWLVGTADDRWTVTPQVRVAVEVALAVLLWSSGLGWQLGAGEALDLAVTAFWIVAVVNAFNLFDNMDGAASSMACVVAGGIAVLGIAQGDAWLSLVAVALCGACIGFLPHNLTSPAKIFLGDGGSMPIGFAVAALTMIGVSGAAPEWQSLAMGLLFVGVPALDTCLVMVSRTRRGISIMTGGRDHLTHRAHQRLSTARAVAIALGGAQAIISALAVVAIEGGSRAIIAAVLVYLVGLGVGVALLDTRLAPVVTSAPAPQGAVAVDAPGPRLVAGLPRELLLLVPLAVVLGLSPFFSGYYDSELWVPGGLAVVFLVTAGVIARPPKLEAPAVLALVGMAGLGAWALGSSLWADSIERAVVDGNRILVYAALLGLLLVFVRGPHVARWLMATLAASTLVVALATIVGMLGSEASSLFVAGRLDGPLGYINGQASYYLLGLWCFLALAESRDHPWRAGLGAGGAALLASLLILSQSRGVAVAAVASVIVVLGLVPGRVRRAWSLVLIGAGTALAAPALLDVYDAGLVEVHADVAAAAARAALLAAVGVGVVWGLLTAGARPVTERTAIARPVATGLLLLLAVGALGVGFAARDSISRTVDQQYTAFVRLGVEPQGSGVGPATTRLASGAGTRHDYWRIAWGAFRENPVVGVGAGNYDRPYFERRATTEDVRQPHSIELQALSELGFVGAGFLLTLLAGLGWGAWRMSRAGRGLAVAAVGGVSAWLAHTSVDWIHLLPGVTGIAVAAAAVLLTSRHAAGPAPAAARASRPRLAPALLVAVCLVFAGLSLSRQGMAEHFRSSAQDALAARPADALRDADRALRLDPEAVQSYHIKAAALARFNEPEAARRSLAAATQREPRNFVTWALLGDLAVRAGDLRAAQRHYKRALRLNPLDPALREAAGDPAGGLRKAPAG